MKQIAQLLKANLGVEAAFTDIGGWDTHQNQGSVNGQLANCLRDFSQGISAFWTDMGSDAENVVLVTMSEFGRTAQQNGTGGTDHGHANVMFVLGGTVKGGKVYGKWPGMATSSCTRTATWQSPQISARFWVKQLTKLWEHATWSWFSLGRN